MNNFLKLMIVGLALQFLPALAAQDGSDTTEGTIHKIDHKAKVMIVKTATGAEHTFRLAEHAVVRGGKAAGKGASAGAHDLKTGTEVVVHYSVKGTEKTAEEIDHIGKDGLKAVKGTIRAIDWSAKTVAVKTVEGTELTFKLTERSAVETGRYFGKGTEKAAKVTVYYTEEAGRKVGHFFKKIAD